MPPFGINPPQPIDFRYPGSFGLNQSAKLPTSFGPPDMASMFQSGISALADPIVSAMKEAQTKADSAKSAADYLSAYKTLYDKQQGGAGGTAMPGATGTPASSGSSSTAGSPAGDASSGTMAGGGGVSNPQVRDTFMNTVKANGLTNQYGLAAVAAYGQRESGWSTGNINRTWQDGVNRSGGALSWNGPRLRAMQEYTAGAENPVVAQAEFLMKENPQLIAALNAAKSPEEANSLMANAWRFKGYNQPGNSEYQARLNLTRAYASRMGGDAAQPAPTTRFAPNVAPAPTPAAAAAVTAPAAPQVQPQQAQFTKPNVNMADYAAAISAALKRNDHVKARELAQERDMVLEQSRDAAAAPQVTPQTPAPAAGGYSPAYMDSGTGKPIDPNDPRVNAGTQARPVPGPQSQAPQQQQQDPQLAAQQQVLGTVGQAADQQAQRLEDTRQQGQRMRVASLDPSVGVASLPGSGQAPPGQIERIFNQPQPQQAQPQPQPQPPAPAPPTGGMNADVFDPNPMLPPGGYNPRPATPAQPAPAAAPAAPAGPAAGSPPQPQPAGVPPVRVAQAQGLPPVVSGQQRGQIDPAMAAVLLRNARTPEEVNRIGAALLQSLQPPAPSADRFGMIHDSNGNWVRIDKLTGQVTPMDAGGPAAKTKGADTVEIETPQGKKRYQWNPANQRYDIPVGADGQPTSGPPSKEVREAERQLFNDFESTETIKKYRELEQSVQGLKAAFSSGNANADLIAIIQLFKTIDPGSTVTGAESASVKNAAGVPETLRALFNKGWGEGGQFSPALRAEIFNTAQRLQQGRVLQVEQHAQAYRNRAKAYGLDPDRTIAFDPFKFQRTKASDFPDIRREGEEDAPSVQPGAQPRVVTPGSAQANPLDVPSQEAAERQPKGTWVRLPPSRPGGKPIIAVVE